MTCENKTNILSKDASEALNDTEAELNAIIENVPVVMLLVDQQRKVRKANTAAASLGNVMQCLHSLDNPDGCGHEPICSSCDLRNVILDTFEKGTGYKSVEIKFPSGRKGIPEDLTLYVSTTLVHLSKEIMNLVCIEDITDFKKREEELIRFNRTLKALSNSSQAMVRASDESSYLKEVCKIIIEDCGHAMVWIGFAEENETKAVRPVVYAGFENGYIEKLNVSWADIERGRGPTGRAIREGRPAECKNMYTDPSFKPWREDAIKRGYMSALALPLKTNQRIFGAITIYSKEVEGFSEDEIKLLSELSDGIAYGIIALRLRITNVQAEERLRRSEKRFRSLAENAPDVIMRLNRDLRFTYVNPRIYRVTGIPPEKFIGRNFENLNTPEHLAKIWNEAFQNALKTKEIQEIEFEFSKASNSRIYNSRIVPELSEDAYIESFLCLSSDVTEERKIRQELIGTRNYLNKLLNYANAPIVVWNSEFKITRFNHAFEKLTHYKSKEVIGKDLSMLYPAESKEESLVRIRQTIDGEQWEAVEVPILTRDERIRIILWNSANIYAEDGKTYVATIAQGQDITERKQTELELEQTASFPKESPYPIMRIGSDGLLRFANPASDPLLHAWNCRVNEALPQGIREFAALALYSDKNVEIELPVGERVYLSTFAPISSAGYVNIYALDITNRKKAENEVIKAKIGLEERVAARTRQLRALAVELTNVEQRERKRLAGILHDNLQQLLVGAKWGIQTAQKKAEDITVQESLARTGELLDESIKASKSLVLELSPPILHEEGLVAAIRWLARWMLETNGLTVNIESDIEIKPDPEGICIILFQSVRELLFNVIKHSHVKTANIYVGLSEGEVRIEVSDEGAGFDYTKQKRQGTKAGFGLFSARERLGLIGGQMHIESSPGSGTRVSVRAQLPKSSVNKENEQIIPESRVETGDYLYQATGRRGQKIRVLVADDHNIVREGLCGMLRSVPDIEVVGEASNGENALELARELRPDIVIMDVNMPKMNGIEATRQITSEMPEIRIIGLSMHEEADRASAMLKAGAVDYVHKAGPSQDLIGSIRAHCRPC